MDILAKLTDAEQLSTRTVEADELRAHNKLHEYKATAEQQLRVLQEAAQAKTKATIEHLQELAKKHGLNPEEVGFNFEQLVFIPKAKQ